MAINAYDRANFAQYTPLSAQEILMPGQVMREQHDKLDEEYANINDQLQKAAFIAQNDPNPKVRNQYANFADSLTKSRDDLMNNGITPTSRRSMYNLRGKFQSEINPMIVGYDLKRESINQYNQMLSKDPTYIGIDPSSRSVSDYINNGLQPITQQGYSGSLITKQVGEAAKQLSDRIYNDPQFRNTLESRFKDLGLGSQYIQAIIQRGINPEDLDTNPILQDLVKDVIKSTGIDQWANEQQMQQAMNFAKQGTYAAVGRTENQFLQDQDYDFSSKMAVAQIKAAASAKKQQDRLNTVWTGLPGDISQVDIEDSKKYLESVKNKLTTGSTSDADKIYKAAKSGARGAEVDEAKASIELYEQMKKNPEAAEKAKQSLVNKMINEGIISESQAQNLAGGAAGYAAAASLAAKSGLISGATLGSMLTSLFPAATIAAMPFVMKSSERKSDINNIFKNLDILNNDQKAGDEISALKQEYPNLSNNEIISMIEEDNRYKSTLFNTRYNSKDAAVRAYQKELTDQLLINANNNNTLVTNKDGKTSNIKDSGLNIEKDLLKNSNYLGLKEYNPKLGSPSYDYQIAKDNDVYTISIPATDLNESYGLANTAIKEMLKPFAKSKSFEYKGTKFKLVRGKKGEDKYSIEFSNGERMSLEKLLELSRKSVADEYLKASVPVSKKSEDYSEFDEE